jgi:hypothetical protein
MTSSTLPMKRIIHNQFEKSIEAMIHIRFSFVLILAVLLAELGCSAPGSGFKKRSDAIERFTLITRGESGQHFTAKLKLDGIDREISGVSPAEFPLEACVLTGTIRKTHGEGTLGLRIVSKEATLSFGNMSQPGDSCRFRYHARSIEIWN